MLAMISTVNQNEETKKPPIFIHVKSNHYWRLYFKSFEMAEPELEAVFFLTLTDRFRKRGKQQHNHTNKISGDARKKELTPLSCWCLRNTFYGVRQWSEINLWQQSDQAKYQAESVLRRRISSMKEVLVQRWHWLPSAVKVLSEALLWPPHKINHESTHTSHMSTVA